MARNSLAPGFVKFKYTGNGHSHIQVVPVHLLTPAGAGSLLVDSSGSNQVWTSFVADWVLLMKPFLHTTDGIQDAELWSQASPTSVPLFQATTSVAVSGTSSSAVVPLSQYRQSFRTRAGGRAAFQLMETVFTIDYKAAAPLYGAFTEAQAVDSYLTGLSSCAWGRDNSYCAAGIQFVTKINDKLRKKYFVP